jgi:DNA polymerase III delta prime subunit
MEWTKLHGQILGQAFKKALGQAEPGAMAFVRCLTPDVVTKLAEDDDFCVQNWRVQRVADSDDVDLRTITADRAVEMREAKGDATLLLVDTHLAGAGMDGIYSASREVDEASLFKEAQRLAGVKVTRQLSSAHRQYAERAIRKAQGFGSQYSVSPWIAFDFLCRIAAYKRHPGAYLHLLGLWLVTESADLDEGALDESRRFVDHLLGTAASGLTVSARIESLRLAESPDEQRRDLEVFLHTAETRPLLSALAKLADKKHLWVGELQIESAHDIQAIELMSWRNRNGSIAKWSGLEPEVKSLVEESDQQLPVLILKPEATSAADYSRLEIRWKARPGNLLKNAVDYRVAVVAGADEELAVRDVSHSAKREEKCWFSNDDFSMLNEDSLVSAKVVVSVVGNDKIESQESEEFIIRFGEPPERSAGGAGRKVRAFSEGLVELDDWESMSVIADNPANFDFDAKGNLVLLRTSVGAKRLSFRISCPPLIREVEKQWTERGGAIGHWRIKVRTSGARAGDVEFIPYDGEGATWDKATVASRKLAARLHKDSGVVGHVYDDKAKAFDSVKEYLRAWTALLESGDPSLALCNTVEVRSLAGRMIGLIVLPIHPLRVAWHAAYDNLVFHVAFEQGQKAKDVRDELQCLDGAMFPAFLPNLDGGSFVFADTLGFHAVGMVPDTDKEPKAAVAMLARALGEDESMDAAPTVGGQSAEVVGAEIVKYLDCHNTSRLLRIHALRAGDGLTIARSLGRVHDRLLRVDDEDDSEEESQSAPFFSLEMYPSEEQRGIVGRFIAEARERRRSSAGVVSTDDQWMLESLSLPGGVNMPKLRWARKNGPDPKTAAHIAVAFDTFESQVRPDDRDRLSDGTFHAFGLLSFYERDFAAKPSPLWRSTVLLAKDGERHPADRAHTKRLDDLQRAIQGTVARHVGAANGELPVLYTEVSREKEDGLAELHRLCDWVITLDRNAGIEYFDSPRDNQTIYDAYVIDCVPEREDLGCLQLITSTSNLEEVRVLFDNALDQMGLSRSRRNAEFLLEHLKALSGRLAIRLTGDKPPTSELIALAVSQANCQQAQETDPCWVSLERGFIVPVDDVRDLLPPLTDKDGDEREVRPDLIYVPTAPRKGLMFRFVEVEYRRDLRAARSPDILRRIREQTAAMSKRWNEWYSHEECSAFRAVRRAKLARVLHFYADKARRHHLPAARHTELVAELDRMIEKGGDYRLDTDRSGDRGWVFCPEYAGTSPLEISPDNWSTKVFLCGPGLLPDLDFRGEMTTSPLESKARPSSEQDAAEGRSTVSVDHLETVEGETDDAIDVIPSICFGTDPFTNTEVRWPLTVQGNPHLLIAGLPGMGKTTCLLNLCNQMMAAGIRPVVFSYHQDIDERLGQSTDSVRFIDFDGLGFNPLEVVDRGSWMAHLDVAGAMRDIFAAIYPELGDIQAERIRWAIKESFVEAGWGNANAAAADLQEPTFGRFVEILRGDSKPDRGLRMLLARLEELEDYGFFKLRESHSSLWESEQPTVIRIHTTQNDNLQRAFASLVFYGLYKDMFRRGIEDRITHALIFDEAHRAAGLKLIPTMAKECRKYGISLVLASQEAKDFDVSVFSAIANYLVLRLTEADAKSLVRNVSSSQQERVLIDKIKQIDRFKALYFCEGKSKPSSVDLFSF